MTTIQIPSPDGSKCIHLIPAGEVHFGPAYYRIAGSGFRLPLAHETLVGDAKWTPDGRSIITTIFHTLGPPANPDTELVRVLVDSGIVEVLDRVPAVVHLISVTDTETTAWVDQQQATFSYT